MKVSQVRIVNKSFWLLVLSNTWFLKTFLHHSILNITNFNLIAEMDILVHTQWISETQWSSALQTNHFRAEGLGENNDQSKRPIDPYRHVLWHHVQFGSSACYVYWAWHKEDLQPISRFRRASFCFYNKHGGIMQQQKELQQQQLLNITSFDWGIKTSFKKLQSETRLIVTVVLLNSRTRREGSAKFTDLYRLH